MKRLLMILAACFPTWAGAANLGQHFDPVASVILWVTLIFFLGVIGRSIAQRFNQPGVLGELLMGVLVGNLCYYFGLELAVILREGSAVFNIMPDMLAGVSLSDSVRSNISDPYYATQVTNALSSKNGMDLIKVSYVVDIFSRYGVIFLLFMVGLDSSIEELKKTGRESVQVAVVGVLAPIIFGLLIMCIIDPIASFKTDLFVAATLSATSIGITGRVLKDAKKLQTHEARTILGAAMIDDILGLILLAIVSGIVVTGHVNMQEVGSIVLLALIFFSAVLVVGPWLLKKAVIFCQFMEPWEAKLFISFVFVMILSWLASIIDLATIIGAFAAGIILHDGIFTRHNDHKNNLTVKELVAPLEYILAPLFFMLIGIQVKIELFFDWHVVVLAAGLIIAAVGGKLLSGLGGNKRDDRFLIGIGMLPRGEVGLVFASIGRALGVISDQLFSAIILMVIVTTLIAPPWLKQRFAAHKVILHDS